MISRNAKTSKDVATSFTCFGCSKEVEMKYGIRGRVICPYCGSRILIKGRTGNPKLVKAR